jgi:hypothetical protein
MGTEIFLPHTSSCPSDQTCVGIDNPFYADFVGSNPLCSWIGKCGDFDAHVFKSARSSCELGSDCSNAGPSSGCAWLKPLAM